MPLVHLQDLRGLTPIEQGRKIYSTPAKYGSEVVRFLQERYPPSSPQKELFNSLHHLRVEDKNLPLYRWVDCYQDFVDLSVESGSVLLKNDISRFEKRLKTETGSPHIPHLGGLTAAYIHYWRIAEAAVRGIHTRHHAYRVNRLKPPVMRDGKLYPHDEREKIDMHKESLAALLHLRDAAEAYGRERDFREILKSSEQFPLYISEAYLAMV